MISTTDVVAAARFVRIAAVTFALALVVGFIALQSFTSQYDAYVSDGSAEPDDALAHAALASAISAQESSGLRCREQPALTDTILFQRLGETAVEVLTFDQAIAASTAREGWIRRYCL